MRYIKTYEKLSDDRVDEIESKIEDVAYMLYDIFDEYSITQCDDESVSYANWRFFRYGNDPDEPKDRIVINVPGELYNNVYNDIKNMRSDIEGQVGVTVEVWGNGHKEEDAFDRVDVLDGRIIVRIKWMKIKDKLRSMLFRKTSDTGPR